MRKSPRLRGDSVIILKASPLAGNTVSLKYFIKIKFATSEIFHCPASGVSVL